jgi:hypothetical protein
MKKKKMNRKKEKLKYSPLSQYTRATITVWSTAKKKR